MPGTEELATGSRLRLKIMHLMGQLALVGGIPAFYVNRLSVRDSGDRELLRVCRPTSRSENLVFSFDFPSKPAGTLRIVGTDNSSNRIDARLE